LSVTGSHDDVAARDVCANAAHADVLSYPRGRDAPRIC